jgi:hypothetical protein
MRWLGRFRVLAVAAAVIALAAGTAWPSLAQAATSAPAATRAAPATTSLAAAGAACRPAASTIIVGCPAQGASRVPAGRGRQDAPAVAPPGYSPAQLQSAYGLQSATAGTGQTVAVVDPYDDPNAESDLAAYRTQFGLPPCTSGCFTKVNQSGMSSPLPPANLSWAADFSAALDMISAICPDCHLLLVETTTPGITDIGAGVTTAVSLHADVITTTVGQAETSADITYDSEYFDQPGVAITAPAGNDGYDVIEYPAASADVTAVGGTTLTPAASTARGWTETPWASTASGCSAYEPKPSWQTDTGCTTTRTIADTAADADAATGVAVYDSYETATDWQPGPDGTGAGGTGIAAAIIAGIYGLAGPPAPGPYPASSPDQSPGGSYTTPGTTSPYPYGLNDITTGSNGTCTPAYLCTAGPGYDAPTGLGTPNGTSTFTTTSLPAGPATYNPANGTQDVYATGTTGSEFQDSWNSATGWSGWANLSGDIASKPAALYNPASSTTQVYGVGPTGTPYEDSSTPAGGWTGWTSMGGTLTGPLAAVYDPATGTTQVYAVGTTGTPYENSSTPAGGWTGWTSLGGTLTGPLAAVYDPINGTTQVYAVGTTGTPYEDSSTPAGAWTGWTSMGGTIRYV